MEELRRMKELLHAQEKVKGLRASKEKIEGISEKMYQVAMEQMNRKKGYERQRLAAEQQKARPSQECTFQPYSFTKKTYTGMATAKKITKAQQNQTVERLNNFAKNKAAKMQEQLIKRELTLTQSLEKPSAGVSLLGSKERIEVYNTAASSLNATMVMPLSTRSTRPAVKNILRNYGDQSFFKTNSRK